MTLTTTSPGYFHFVLHGAENTHNVIAAVVAISKRSTGLTRHGCAHNERLDAPTTLGAFVSSNIRVFCAAGIWIYRKPGDVIDRDRARGVCVWFILISGIIACESSVRLDRFQFVCFHS